MDAEQLRKIYNARFSQNEGNWRYEDWKKPIKVSEKCLQWLKRYGQRNSSIKLLDVGCATGHYTESFRLLGCKTTGLDYSEVAIEKAREKFPACSFVQMNGFEPQFKESFDVIFCRGFSGANTHDLQFMAQWINRYLQYINPGGFFIFSFTSNFSGKETGTETANHSHKELRELTAMINGKFEGIHYFHYFGFLSALKKSVSKLFKGKNIKDEYYLLFRKM